MTCFDTKNSPRPEKVLVRTWQYKPLAYNFYVLKTTYVTKYANLVVQNIKNRAFCVYSNLALHLFKYIYIFVILKL